MRLTASACVELSAVAVLMAGCRVSLGGTRAAEEGPSTSHYASAPVPGDTGFEPLLCDQPDLAAVSADAWRRRRERYVSGVARGIRRPFGSALRACAEYIVGLHNRLHPVFADEYVARQELLSPIAPREGVFSVVEIVISASGGLDDLGIVRSSGIAKFDVASLQAFVCLAPFAPPPKELLSSDGRLYLQWELHAELDNACSAQAVMPYLIDFRGR